MWKIVYNLETGIVSAVNSRDQQDGEGVVYLDPTQCGWVNVYRDRYKVVNGFLVERPEWAAEEATRIIDEHRRGLVCGPLQFRKALRAAGLHAAAVAYVNGADEETQEAWEYAGEFKRLDPFILAAQVALDKTDEEVDALFQLALTF